MSSPRATCFPGGVLLSAPYDPVATPALVDDLKRLIPAHGRRYLPETREWFVVAAYHDQALAIFCRHWPQATIRQGDGDGPEPASSVRRPLAEERHYATLFLLPGAPVPLIDAAYKVLAKLHHPDLLPPPQRHQSHQAMCAINAAYEALHAHATAGGD